MNEPIVVDRKNRPWLVLILSVFVGALFGYTYTKIQPCIYDARTTLSFTWADPVVDEAFRQESHINLADDGQRMRDGQELFRLLAEELYPDETVPDEIKRRQEKLRNIVCVNQNYRDGMYSVPYDTRSTSIYRAQKSPALCVSIRCGDKNEAESIARAVEKVLPDSFAALIMPLADTFVAIGRHEPAMMEKVRREYAERVETYRYFFVSNPPRITAQTNPAMLIYPRGHSNTIFCAFFGLIVGIIIITVGFCRRYRRMPASIPTRGYIWAKWGFTRLHILGLNIVGGIIMVVGTATATLATMGLNFLPEKIFWRCVAVSGCASLICIAMALGSIFALTFYAGAKRFNLTEETKEAEDKPHAE